METVELPRIHLISTLVFVVVVIGCGEVLSSDAGGSEHSSSNPTTSPDSTRDVRTRFENADGTVTLTTIRGVCVFPADVTGETRIEAGEPLLVATSAEPCGSGCAERLSQRTWCGLTKTSATSLEITSQVRIDVPQEDGFCIQKCTRLGATCTVDGVSQGTYDIIDGNHSERMGQITIPTEDQACVHK